jgi:uncharacterized repeat protein (TIGR02543 family)
MPANPARPLYTFGGWYTARNGGGTQFTPSTVVSGNITVYAKWTALSFNDALVWINVNAVEGGAYTITLTRDETIAPTTLYYSGKSVSITIRGDATKRTINLGSSGSLFAIHSGVTLTLDNNTVLRGRSDNNTVLVSVNSGGKLVMNAGSEISGNTASSNYGGGVYVSGAFTMSGGTISGNTASYYGGGGGGVYVYSGTFTMNGGTISGNTASSGGGGVYTDLINSTFTMSGGEISGNTSSYGGGVYSVTFTMNGGTISGNTASYYGGVYSVTFTMNGGTISGNTASSYGGGGVYVSGAFTMSGGTISGNTASSYRGGGVYVYDGTFTMSGGTISGNAASDGGGVYVSGAFTKQSGGIIYGSDAGAALKNTATSGESNGHAVYVWSGSKKRNTTAGVGVTLDSSIAGPAGGWE